MSPFVQTIYQAASEVADNATAVANNATAVANNATAVANNVTSQVPLLPPLGNVTVQGVIAGIGSAAKNWYHGLIVEAQGAASVAVADAKNYIHQLPDKIMEFIYSIPVLLLALLIGFLNTIKDVVGKMVVQISSQIIGTGIIGVALYQYRDNLKDVIRDVVMAAGAMVPENWVDEEAVIDIVEEAAGVDTPSGSEDEGEDDRKPKSGNTIEPNEDTPLLNGHTSPSLKS